MVVRCEDLDLNIFYYFTCLPHLQCILNIITVKGAGNVTVSSSHLMLEKRLNAQFLYKFLINLYCSNSNMDLNQRPASLYSLK